MIGIEKESLRVRHDGFISHAAHPSILGSSLTHPCITTDFSEALIELVTPPCNNSVDVLTFLTDTETFVHQQLPGEYLWATSMPCSLRGEDDIPIAYYGQSKMGKMKTIYRRGLAHRYGKIMQVIAGTHFNYSLPENLLLELQGIELQESDPERVSQSIPGLGAGRFAAYKNQKYMAMVRNIQRYGWLNLYLFGASPAICSSFVDAKPDILEQFDQRTLYHPFATSLRMSNIGYTNNRTHSNIHVSYDSIEEYLQTLGAVINTPHPEYADINRISTDSPQQLNGNILQIENEYYTSVRPKQVPQNDESHFQALQQRGIRYVELRSLDINPFSSSGIEQEQIHFLEVFMHYCLLKNSPSISANEEIIINQNLNQVAIEGRKPHLQITREGTSVTMQQWALEIMHEMRAIAEKLDSTNDTLRYTRALNTQRNCVVDPQQTPSARILAEMHEHQESFTEFAMRKSIQHHNYFKNRNLGDGRYKYYQYLSRKSHRQQQQMEKRDHSQETIDRRIANSDIG